MIGHPSKRLTISDNRAGNARAHPPLTRQRQGNAIARPERNSRANRGWVQRVVGPAITIQSGRGPTFSRGLCRALGEMSWIRGRI